MASGEPNDANRLVFEAREPRSIAELEFRKPWADVSTEVRGQLFLGGSAPQDAGFDSQERFA